MRILRGDTVALEVQEGAVALHRIRDRVAEVRRCGGRFGGCGALRPKHLGGDRARSLCWTAAPFFPPPGHLELTLKENGSNHRENP